MSSQTFAKMVTALAFLTFGVTAYAEYDPENEDAVEFHVVVDGSSEAKGLEEFVRGCRSTDRLVASLGEKAPRFVGINRIRFGNADGKIVVVGQCVYNIKTRSAQ